VRNVAALRRRGGRDDGEDFRFVLGMLDGEWFGECFNAACGDGVVGVDDDEWGWDWVVEVEEKDCRLRRCWKEWFLLLRSWRLVGIKRLFSAIARLWSSIKEVSRSRMVEVMM
jgi:hypothetical protein